MSDIKERLDRLKETLGTSEFLEGKGLSNEVNIRIFCYEPADEMAVRDFVMRVRQDNDLPCRIIERDLYEIFLGICEQKKITQSIPKMEERKGKEYLLKQLQNIANARAFIERIQYAPHESGRDVLMLIGIGDVFPFMRVHVLLETLQPEFSDIPVVVMYPGSYDGHYLKLFNMLQPNDYYRAFNLI